jgi:thioredoxin-like negative regulator of GroEL
MPSSQGGTSGSVISGYHIGSADYMNLVGDQVVGDGRDMKPSAPGPADIEFEKGIGAFDVNDFSKAADHFFRACQYAPEDNILALAYAQALFAENRYYKAAEVLRDVLERIRILEEGLFYPRGLYAQDEILFQQIDALIKEAERDSGNRDLQLLLGYQLMGIGEIDLAKEPLENARKDLTNNKAAQKLISLLEIIEQQAEQTQTPAKQGQELN